MSPSAHAASLGVTRGWAEFWQSITNRQDQIWLVVINGILITVLVFQRNSTIDGVSLAVLTLPSLLGMTVVMGGIMGAGGSFSADREDGTLLRAKAVPNGMIGYLVSRIVLTLLSTMFGLVVLFVAGLFLLDGLAETGLAGWLTLLWVLILGLLSTLPWGVIIGASVKSSASGFGLTMLPVAGLVTISGIFYPISAMPGWVQGIAHVFPVYWLGLGMRSALLPDSAVAAEIGESWRHLETAGVLGVWAVVGMLIAPTVLRRMARRESGSLVQDRKERVLQRGY